MRSRTTWMSAGERALRYIRHSLAHDPAAAALATLLDRGVSAQPETLAMRVRRAVVGTYRAVVAHRWALWVAVFVVQFLAFYWDQLRALAGLIASIVILGIVNYAIRQEERGDEQTDS